MISGVQKNLYWATKTIPGAHLISYIFYTREHVSPTGFYFVALFVYQNQAPMEPKIFNDILTPTQLYFVCLLVY
jgi:hypothetical protein